MNDTQLDSPYTNEEIEAFRPAIVRDPLRQAQAENARLRVALNDVIYQLERTGVVKFEEDCEGEPRSDSERTVRAYVIAMDALICPPKSTDSEAVCRENCRGVAGTER